MGLTQEDLPFAPSDIPAAAHASCKAAEQMAEHAPTQLRVYVEWLYAQGRRGGTDLEACDSTKIARASLCARRKSLLDTQPEAMLRSNGFRKRRGRIYTVWVLPSGLDVEEILRRAAKCPGW